jgi:hypothetical protein
MCEERKLLTALAHRDLHLFRCRQNAGVMQWYRARKALDSETTRLESRYG